MKINKKELMEKTAERTRMPIDTVKTVLDGISDEIISCIANGDDVGIYGFGTFKMQKMKEKPGRDIHRGKVITIPEHYKLKFLPSKNLQEIINDTK